LAIDDGFEMHRVADCRVDVGQLPNGKVQPKSEWEQQQAAEQADDVRLKRKLIICRDCVIAESAHGEATGSAGR
jgi:hypothetical protein